MSHDLIGVGIGPFNLGLAALLEPVAEIDALFFDQRPAFDWHPGLMLDDSEIQVPFLADLVTFADPTSRHTFLAYLHEHARLYRFYFHERFHVTRREFAAYLRWASERLHACRFGQRVESVRRDGRDGWSVAVRGADGETAEHAARTVVLGVGTAPWTPACAVDRLGADVLHSADYLPRRERVLSASSVTIVGSGQSAAEVFADLLDNASPGTSLRWYTRSPGFYPMEYSKLGLEHFTPEYTAYFHGLDADRRDAVRSRQDLLYKGISPETSDRIYDTLYRRTIDSEELDVEYAACCELRGVAASRGAWGRRLELRQLDQDVDFEAHTDVLVLATGYRDAPLPLALEDVAELDARGRPRVELDGRVRLREPGGAALFLQNATLHSHGVGTPDLGLLAHRNAVIANAVCGREVYAVRERNVFQTFGAPARPAAGKEAAA